MNTTMFPALNLTNIPTTASSLFSAYASFAAFIVLARSMADQLIPHQLRRYLHSLLRHFYTPRSSNLTLIVDEKSGMNSNQVYEAAEVYLQTKISPLNERLRVSKTPRQKTLSLTIDKNQEIMDTFENIKLKWQYVCTETKERGGEKRQFELMFHKKHKALVMEAYLPYVLTRAKAINEEEKVLKLNSHQSGSVDLEHPSTFDTLAIDPELKSMIIDDLDRFVKRKGFYKKVGKAWKRGYLLYGPPGTGKSSLIAAMANYLKFDVYDLELSSIYDDSQLKRTLLATSNRSILVIEDIDCSVETENRESESRFQRSNNSFSLSGLLNFIDGLWILASNYLGIHESNPHRLCGEIEGLIESTKVTPAEIAEELMKSDDADVALEGLVNFLKRKEVESNKSKDEGTNKTESQKAN
ncbi:hypothetical protein M0R45_004127 [Rubus argutus]|uniref:AAA+ ATPase domain-containing protein n=1 Tax=Rubus argutus TaxID=59490 RepID=A0AAW1YIX7_RUBAR